MIRQTIQDVIDSWIAFRENCMILASQAKEAGYKYSTFIENDINSCEYWKSFYYDLEDLVEFLDEEENDDEEED